jgi:hydrogenase nickel incorporation protein HypA/HybF
MHELGIVMEIARVVGEIARDRGVAKVHAVVLELGEGSSVVPEYLKACFPAAVDGTALEGAALEIETVPALARCARCGVGFKPGPGGSCPGCGSPSWDLISGNEFSIKEIRAL